MKTIKPFEVKISENHPDKPQTWRVFLDREFTAKLRVIKKDSDTKQTVLVPNAEFKLYGVELDSISGRIAKQLYQNANISITGFENTTYPDNFFDVVVGNVPFGDYKVYLSFRYYLFSDTYLSL